MIMVRKCRGKLAFVLALVMTVSSLMCPVIQDEAYAASGRHRIKSSKQWGKKVSDKKLNKLNGTNYYTRLPGVNMYACVGYAEWALNRVYRAKPTVPSYSLVRYLRAYFIRHGNPVVAYGSYVSKKNGGDGEYIEKGEIRPGDIVFFFHRGKKNGKIKMKPIGKTRGKVNTHGAHFWTHVAVASGKGKGMNVVVHDNSTGNPGGGIAMSSTIKGTLERYSTYGGATDYQVFRVLRQGKGRIYVLVTYKKKSWYNKDPKLSGAKFVIKEQKLKTDKTGRTEKSDKLNEGKHTITIVKAPRKFKALEPEEKKVKVKQYRTTKAVFEVKPVIEVHKIFIRKRSKEKTGQKEGAVFRVWPVQYGKYSTDKGWWDKIPKRLKATLTTDSEGKARTKRLPSNSRVFDGRYYVHQIQVPEGAESTVVNKRIRLKKSRADVLW